MEGGSKGGIKLDFSNIQILVQVQEIQLFEIRPKVIDNSTMEFGFLECFSSLTQSEDFFFFFFKQIHEPHT